jgi:hypothetical protein
MNPNVMHIALLAAIILLSQIEQNKKEAVSASETKILFEVSCGGDDNLTRGVCIAVEKALESSEHFAWNTDAKKGALVVIIPTNVHWKELNQRTRVFYKVEFTSSEGKKISKDKGSCWEDELATCSSQIVKESIIAGRKLQPRH